MARPSLAEMEKRIVAYKAERHVVIKGMQAEIARTPIGPKHNTLKRIMYAWVYGVGTPELPKDT